MQFAVNYSPPLMKLIEQRALDIPLIKCPDWPNVVHDALTRRDAYVHFELYAGNGKARFADQEHIEALLGLTATPYINLHVEPNQVPADHSWSRDRAFAAVRSDLEWFCQRFGADRVIIENIPYEGPEGNVPGVFVEPDLFCRAVEATGCGFLLDLAHATVSSHLLGLDVREYVEQFPLHHLRELHVSGVLRSACGAPDHFPMSDSDWSLLDWALSNIAAKQWATPTIIAFEYGGVGPAYADRSDVRVLQEQVPSMQAKLREYGLTQ